MGGEWRASTWGEEITLEYGKALRGHETASGPYRVFGSNGPIGWTEEALAPGPGVILGRKGAYRGVQFSRDPFFVIDTAYYVAPKTDLDMRWLYYAIKHHKLGEIDDGSPIPSTTRAAVYMLDLDVPSLAEQGAIAHILGTLDDKIELNRRMSETLEAMARALFKSWFIDFDPVRRNAARARNQPSPPTPLPRGEGRNDRGGYDFSGLVETARDLRKSQTPAEEIFWALVRDRRLLGLKFRRQHQLGDYIADFYCHEHRLVVELDGGVHSAKQRRDAKRNAWMQAQDFTVLRFPNDQILEDPESVLARIAETILPSPFGRGAGGEGVIESIAFDHLFPARLVDSELGEIPEGWEVGTLGDIAEHPRRGVQPDSIAPDTPYIALEHMPKRCIALSDWGIADGLESNKFEFMKGEILFGKLRPYFHKVGVAPVDGVCSTDIVVVVPKEPHWFAFVVGLVSSDEFVEYTNAGSTGTKMPRTSWADMVRYEIELPPECVAEAFTALLQPSVARVIASIHESRTLAALRDTLLPKLISGELRIEDAEKFIGRAV